MLQSLNMVHFHFTLSLRAHQLQNGILSFPQNDVWINFKNPYIFTGTAFGPCVKWPLIHSKLHSITHVATKVHKILQSLVVLTWMRDNIELV